MKAVLISIRPEWVRKILNGSKTVEIRKTAPKCGVPFKCYIYCTAGGKGTLMVRANAGPPAITAESAYEREQAEAFGYEAANGKIVAEFTCNKIGAIYPLCMIPKWATADACLTREEIQRYLGTEHGYGMQIDDLKIYDTPRELSEFIGLREMKDGFELSLITRPPQSWRYVGGKYMARLTKRLPDGKVVTDCDSCEQKTDKQCTLYECRTSLIKRLAAYEDTGLEPEEVETIKLALAAKHFVELETLNNTQISRLVELAVADDERRVVVLPCKVGDVVYGFHGDRTILPMVAKWIETNTDGWCVVAQYAPMAPKFYQFSDFGKTVFLAREEAEKALEARNGDQ